MLAPAHQRLAHHDSTAVHSLRACNAAPLSIYHPSSKATHSRDPFLFLGPWSRKALVGTIKLVRNAGYAISDFGNSIKSDLHEDKTEDLHTDEGLAETKPWKQVSAPLRLSHCRVS